MSLMVDSVEQRVLELVKKHVEGQKTITGTRIERVQKQHAYEYEWYEDEPVSYTEVDSTERDAAFAELMQIGKPALPTLVKIITSERGEYPNEYSRIIDGVGPPLRLLADKEVSKSLVQPFQQKVDKISYENQEPYDCQIWSISHILSVYPVSEATPALYAAITKKTNEKHFFSQYTRQNCFDALAGIGTKEAVTKILTAAVQDAQSKHQSDSNYALALRCLEQKIFQNGKILYEIYGTTEDAQIKEITSEALSWTKSIYWLRKKLHL